MLVMPLAGCMHGNMSNKPDRDVEQKIEIQTEENKSCPDGKCPDGVCPGSDSNDGDGECPDGKCPENKNGKGDKCPDGECPAKPVRPNFRNGNGRIVPLPAPHKG